MMYRKTDAYRKLTRKDIEMAEKFFEDKVGSGQFPDRHMIIGDGPERIQIFGFDGEES